MSFSRRALAVATVVAATFPASAAVAAQHDSVTAVCTADWLGTATPTLTGTTTGTAARFGLWDVTTDQKLVDRQVDATEGKLSVTTDALTDGHRYEWRFWPQGGGKPTAKCGFGVDTTAPVASVESTDFPAEGGGKFAGQKGVFTLRAAETGSGVACYQYVLDGTLSVGGCGTGAGYVQAGPDGTATITLKPRAWGSHVLQVQAVDRAGNVTQPTTYSFYAPWNPNAPKAYGDLDGDGVPDIALPDAAGNLQVISTDAGTTEPTFTLPAYTAPGGSGSWAGLDFTHGGWQPGRDPIDDLIVRQSGGSGYYAFRGGLDPQHVSPSYAQLPTAAGLVWSHAEQLVAIGSGTRSEQDRQYLALVDGDLWRITPASALRLKAERLSTTGAWAGYQLIGPGPDAAGNLTVWAREKATGTLSAFAVPRDAAGAYDFTALAAPANGTVLGSFPLDGYPTVGSVGDADGDGTSDLYAVTADRHLLLFSGVTAPKDRGVLQ